MILHIFRKDVRRLWPHILVTLILLGALASFDRFRDDWMAGATEGWLNLLMPLVWACLIGLAIEQEPLVGERQFWTTRPYRRGVLLAAKALFVVAFIHLPYFATSVWVVAGRGFSPIEHLPQLLWNHVLLAAAVTLPAMAMASLVRSFTHFILEVVAVAALVIFLNGAFVMDAPRWETVDAVRRGVAILIAGVAAVGIVWIQYANRRPMFARSLGIAAAALAGGLFSWLLPQSAFAVRSALDPVPAELTMRLSSRGEDLTSRLLGAGFGAGQSNILVAIPIEISGLPESLGLWMEPTGAEAIGPGGDRYRSSMRIAGRPPGKPSFDTSVYPYRAKSTDPLRLTFRFDRSVFERLRGGKSRITGHLGVTLVRTGQATWMPVGVRQQVAGVGLCETSMVSYPWVGDRIKVECESPSRLPKGTTLRAWHPGTGEDWTTWVAYGRNLGPNTRATPWFSALDRQQGTFIIVPARDPRYPRDRFSIPAELAEAVRIEITPEHLAGYADLAYDFRDLDLNRYVVTPHAR